MKSAIAVNEVTETKVGIKTKIEKDNTKTSKNAKTLAALYIYIYIYIDSFTKQGK